MDTIQLTAEEQNVLESIYGRQMSFGVGYNPRKLESIKELNDEEKNFFTGKNFVSPKFFVQTLYKVRGTVSPIKINIAINRMLNDNENLRANFCNLGTRTVKVIRPAAAFKPEIIFRNLTQSDKDELDEEFRKILEADMRRDCDLRHDLLIRFAIYKTSSEEFALLVTAAQLILDNFDADNFFNNLFDLPEEFKEKQLPEELPPNNQEVIREYWAKVLDKMPPPVVLPYERAGLGAYHQKAFRTTIPADIFSELRGKAQSNRMMLTAILQTAWGFMLQLTNKRRDCLFCQILSSGKVEDVPSLNVIPVRIIGEENLTVEQIVRKQFRQLVVSQSYSNVDWESLENLSGRIKNSFNHFLSFKEFQSSELNYVDNPSDVRGKIILRNSWDAQGMKLGVYFRYSKKTLPISFLYDERQFKNSGLEQLCKLYKFVLQQMMLDWDSKYSEFMGRIVERIDIQSKFQEPSHEDERKKIRNFLSQLSVLQGRYGGTIDLFENNAEILKCYEGDRISGNMLKENFIFIMDGILSRNADTGDGWYNTLDIVEKNCFVNPTDILEKQLFTLSVEVLTDKAELLLIPHDVLIETIHKNSEVAMSIINFAIKQMERYQLLWLQS